jgi:hypothetical protein
MAIVTIIGINRRLAPIEELLRVLLVAQPKRRVARRLVPQATNISAMQTAFTATRLVAPPLCVVMLILLNAQHTLRSRAQILPISGIRQRLVPMQARHQALLVARPKKHALQPPMQQHARPAVD